MVLNESLSLRGTHLLNTLLGASVFLAIALRNPGIFVLYVPADWARRSIMKKVWKIFKWIVEGLSSITGGIAALGLVAAAFVVTHGIITRKVFGLSAIWQIEASVYLLIFACFVGASFAQKQEHHLNVDLVLIHLPPRARERTLIIVSVVACLICGLIAIYAWPMWWEVVVRNDHSESLWGPPLWIPYFFIPFGMSLLFFQYIVYIAGKITALRRGEIAEEAERLELRDIEIPSADSGGGK
jgi:TRAP-type C4-dicarboxylate transport system permease small subunit